MKRSLPAILAVLFTLAAPLAASAQPAFHLDVVGSAATERNDNNDAALYTYGLQASKDLNRKLSIFAGVGKGEVTRSRSPFVAAGHYTAATYDVGSTLHVSPVTSFTIDYGRSIDDGVIRAAQPRTIRSLTLTGDVRLF